MKLLLLLFAFVLVNSLTGYSQGDLKPVVGVAKFTSEINSKYAGAVGEKVIEVITNTRRFTVVDRTSYDKVKEELELQKSEAFLDSKTARQDAALAAQYILVGNILKMNVYNMKNPDGSVNGYKASSSFTLKVNNVESGTTTEAETFQTDVSPMMLSPESAVHESLKSIDAALASYIIKTFPLTTAIKRVLVSKKDAAASVLIGGGKTYGFKVGDKLTVQKIDLIDGKPYPTEIGQLKISKIAGDDFSECSVTDGGKEIQALFNAGEKVTCVLIQK